MGFMEDTYAFNDKEVAAGNDLFKPTGANTWRIALLPQILEPENDRELEALKKLQAQKLAEPYTLDDKDLWLYWSAVGAPVHYLNSIRRTVLCLSTDDHKAICCEHDPEGPSHAFVTVILRYMVDSDGQYVDGEAQKALLGSKIMLWKLTEAKFRQIRSTHDSAYLPESDLKLEGKPQGPWTNIDIRNFAGGALWRKNKKFEASILRKVQKQKHWEAAPKFVGSRMTESELRDRLGLSAASSPTTADFDDSVLDI